MMEVLLDLTRYKYAPLRALAFALIDRYMMEKASLLRRMLSTHIIVDPDVLRLYKQVLYCTVLYCTVQYITALPLSVLNSTVKWGRTTSWVMSSGALCLALLLLPFPPLPGGVRCEHAQIPPGLAGVGQRAPAGEVRRRCCELLAKFRDMCTLGNGQNEAQVVKHQTILNTLGAHTCTGMGSRSFLL